MLLKKIIDDVKTYTCIKRREINIQEININCSLSTTRTFSKFFSFSLSRAETSNSVHPVHCKNSSKNFMNRHRINILDEFILIVPVSEFKGIHFYFQLSKLNYWSSELFHGDIPKWNIITKKIKENPSSFSSPITEYPNPTRTIILVNRPLNSQIPESRTRFENSVQWIPLI